MTPIVNNKVYSNGKIEVKVIDHFSRWEDYVKSEMIDFVFAINTETNETIVRTQKEFREEFIDGLKVTLESFFDTYLANGQYEPNITTKEHFVDWFDSDYILTIVSDTTGIGEREFLEYAPIYYNKKLRKQGKKGHNL